MKTNYFDGLFDDLPEPVTHVTQPENDCVTPETVSVTSENSDLSEPLRTLRTLRTETGNTGQETQRTLKAYHYRLRDCPASELVYIAPGTSLAEATEGLRARFGDRLIDVKRYIHGTPPADDGASKGE